MMLSISTTKFLIAELAVADYNFRRWTSKPIEYYSVNKTQTCKPPELHTITPTADDIQDGYEEDELIDDYDLPAHWLMMQIFDMLGGGFISDFVKHSKMNDASALMEQAKSDIQRFQRELRDVQVSLDLRMEIGSFLSFADFFLDGLVADYMVQSKITDAREQVDDAINRIEKILADVKNRMNAEVY